MAGPHHIRIGTEKELEKVIKYLSDKGRSLAEMESSYEDGFTGTTLTRTLQTFQVEYSIGYVQFRAAAVALNKESVDGRYVSGSVSTYDTHVKTNLECMLKGN